MLSDGWLYALWVVGAARMRDVDEGWPAVGTRLHHSVGTWPLLIDDTTEVLEVRGEPADPAARPRVAGGTGPRRDHASSPAAPTPS